MLEVNRENFDKFLKKYHDYVELYRFFNNGSTQGVTPFDEFYWRLTYFVKYQDAAKVGQSGY